MRSSRARYVAATADLGSKGFFYKPADRSSRAATYAFRRNVEALPDTGAQAKVRSLVLALSRQEKLFTALQEHNLADVRKYGNELNGPLEQGLKSLQSLCPGA